MSSFCYLFVFSFVRYLNLLFVSQNVQTEKNNLFHLCSLGLWSVWCWGWWDCWCGEHAHGTEKLQWSQPAGRTQSCDQAASGMFFDTRWGSRRERSCLFECNRDTSSNVQSWLCQVTTQIVLIVWPSCCPLLPFMLIQGLWISSPSPRTVSQLMLPKSWNSCTGIASPAALSHSLCWKATTASAPWGHL